MSFDADTAGLKAGERGVVMALASGMDVKMVKIPAGLDPADLIVKDASLWKKALGEAKHIVDFLLEHIEEKKTDERSYRLEVGKHVLPYVASIENKIDQGHFIKKIASNLLLPEEDIRAEVEKLIKNQMASSRSDLKGSQGPTFSQPGIKTMKNQILEKILGIYLWQPGLKDLAKDYQGITGTKIDEEADKLTVPAKNDLVFQAEMYYPEEGKLEKELTELLNNLEKEILEEHLAKSMSALREAEKKKDEKESEKILKECHKISQRINEIKNSRFLEK